MSYGKSLKRLMVTRDGDLWQLVEGNFCDSVIL